MPSGAIYVGRPSKFGNPFTIRGAIEAGYASTEAEARIVATDAFEDWLDGDPWAAPACGWETERAELLKNIDAHLPGKDLACWCPLFTPCHGDVLLKYANRRL